MQQMPPIASNETSPTAAAPPYWFHAKRYGWGWGLPARREGWVVFAAWLVVVLGSAALLAGHHSVLFIACTTVASAALLGICYAKGEPPRWRWGDSQER